ncbi:hypothetical protein [Pseudoclavibacter sp. CFCC 13611]|uniref:hypothetical protein n=1 Tax=Pseudoclavibacter sp. CFCC 13611 TaxID=2615178 RepID=UPI00130155A7|nr:hypothetical protein [Pseudoclavibacter sp. CFCC 13611]KAB1663607.1 hypothetical protein F8O08_07735 [Pseudoclavibacter sp. CFCC 13611]
MSRPSKSPGTHSPISVSQVAERWVARCRVYSMNGAARQIERSGPDEASALDSMHEALSKMSDSTQALGTGSTLEAAGRQWLEAYKRAHPNAAAGTLEQYQRCLNRTLQNRLKRVLVSDLSVPLLEGMIASILDERGAWNAKMARIVLGMVCQHLVRMGLIDRDFAAATTPIRRRRRSGRR